MMLTAMMSIIVVAYADPAALGPQEYGHGLTAEQGKAGWISLHDSKTTFGWEGARVARGVLVGGRTTGAFGAVTIQGRASIGGTLRLAGKVVARPKAGETFQVSVRGLRGRLELADELAVETLILKPMALKTILDGQPPGETWKRVDRPSVPAEKRPVWRVEKGKLHAVGGPGALEYTGGRFGDFVLQMEVRSLSRHANGGLFFRNQPGTCMMGYEAQIHSRCEAGDPARPSRYSTGGIDDRQNARRLVSRDFQPFLMTVIASGSHLATWVNGYQMTDWTDTRPEHENPRRGLRLEPGTLQLQAHDPDTDIEFGPIRIVELSTGAGNHASKSSELLDRPLRVLTANIWNYAAPYQQRMKLLRQEIVKLDPDLISFQEAGWEPGRRHQVAKLLDGLGYTIHHEYDGTDRNQRSGIGISLASRWPTERVLLRKLPHGRALIAEVAAPAPGGQVLFCATFGSRWQLNQELLRERDAVALDRIIRDLADPTRLPPIITGDFDATPESACIRFLTGKQSLAGVSTHYVDAWRIIHKKEKRSGSTWTSENPYVARTAEGILYDPDHHRRIDYIFMGSPHHYRRYARVVSARVALNRPVDGVYPSDHYGVFAEIDVTQKPPQK